MNDSNHDGYLDDYGDRELLQELMNRYPGCCAFIGVEPSVILDGASERLIMTHGDPLKVIGALEYLKYRSLLDYNSDDNDD